MHSQKISAEKEEKPGKSSANRPALSCVPCGVDEGLQVAHTGVRFCTLVTSLPVTLAHHFPRLTHIDLEP